MYSDKDSIPCKQMYPVSERLDLNLITILQEDPFKRDHFYRKTWIYGNIHQIILPK